MFQIVHHIQCNMVNVYHLLSIIIEMVNVW